MTDSLEPPPPAESDEPDPSEVVRRYRDDPQFETTMAETIERGIASSDDRFRAIQNLVNMVERYLGDWDLAFMFLSAIARPDDLAEITESTDADANTIAEFERAVRRLGAVYGHALSIGLELTTRSPSDWKYLKVRPRYEPEAPGWFLEARFQLFDESEIKVDGDPLSILRICIHLLTGLRTISEHEPDLGQFMDQDGIDTFTDVASAIIDSVNGGSDASSGLTKTDEGSRIEFADGMDADDGG